MKISFAKPALPASGTVVVGILAGRKLTATARSLDKSGGGHLSRAMEAAAFEGRAEQTLTILAPAGSGLSRLVLLGMGEAAKLDTAAFERLGGATWSAIANAKDKDVTLVVDALPGCNVPIAQAAAHMAIGALLRSYRFDRYRTEATEKKDDKPQVGKLIVSTADHDLAKKAFAPMEAVAEGVFLTRDLQSEPANILGPVEFSEECQKLEKLGIKVSVLTEKEMKKLGMNALLGVGQGSARGSRTVILEWNGSKAKTPPLAVIGKGVCFDSGGISIKPAGGMEDMKWDMGGAGVVTGLMAALARRKAKANVVGFLGLVENMPSGTAQRPGDVVRSMSGQTIEVINTDAEGRLVLADVLTYAQRKYKPATIIDLATLTGAIIIALGMEHAGLFSNDDTLAGQLTKAGQETGEKLWRLPMGDSYDKLIKSDIADMKNVGDGRGAGSITAAQFLARFVESGTPWAHLDIAGTTWTNKDLPLASKGATAFGVRLLDRYITEHIETKR
ncbi:leucyl aminopeptidase [Haematospirillum jordaniae]|uniref:Probable cytosol aminopeptidase n=1 Tax=Haematospirillum jordaniae TaxID=1549855 RepID=A0A143DC95_9PROT|nr:leucyl aminopeptidase [Haematospirillum jordaniae]AMW33893.1 aminopeptidase [Haematospirillum jordaniae]NKD44461.1 leucyl aminopeptidase [Haematospirillum jordaniae]NKD57481.1 leucyl aminopeptidase [Haematospirillum jordaniae]NKD59541.1 leucyl aminopeptidase [Haematospirillum jordaniae]NKD67535.1 leucyl aminopeptidase [Haematospirillum jordaniae]